MSLCIGYSDKEKTKDSKNKQNKKTQILKHAEGNDISKLKGVKRRPRNHP